MQLRVRASSCQSSSMFIRTGLASSQGAATSGRPGRGGVSRIDGDHGDGWPA